MFNQARREPRMFEITHLLLPRLFHVYHLSGVKEMRIFLENAREYVMANRTQLVECPRALLLLSFGSGRQVQARGNLRVRFNSSLKIERMEFDTRAWVEFSPRLVYGPVALLGNESTSSRRPSRRPSRQTSESGKTPMENANLEADLMRPDSPRTLEEVVPINEYGITEMSTILYNLNCFNCNVAMRFLEIWEVFNVMDDLLSLNVYAGVSPKGFYLQLEYVD